MPNTPTADDSIDNLIDGYDDLTILEVTKHLRDADLTDDEMGRVADYEIRHENRLGLMRDGPLADYAPLPVAEQTTDADDSPAPTASLDTTEVTETSDTTGATESESEAVVEAETDVVSATEEVAETDDVRVLIRFNEQKVAGHYATELPELRIVPKNKRLTDAVEAGRAEILREV